LEPMSVICSAGPAMNCTWMLLEAPPTRAVTVAVPAVVEDLRVTWAEPLLFV